MKFSIITPSYNQGQFIQETIDSVVNQVGDFDIEYFVMDGGSTDNTVEILKAIEIKLKNNPKIKFYWQSKKDAGQVDALNQALAKCTGDIVAYINSDDYYLPNAFATVAKHFFTHPKSLWLVGNCQVSDPKLAWTFWLKHIWPIHIFKWASLTLNTINQPSVFLTKSLVKKAGLFNPKYPYTFDHEYWLRCLNYGLPGRIFKYLSVFRIQPDSKGNTAYKKQLDEDYEIVSNYSNNNKLILLINRLGRKITELNYQQTK